MLTLMLNMVLLMLMMILLIYIWLMPVKVVGSVKRIDELQMAHSPKHLASIFLWPMATPHCIAGLREKACEEKETPTENPIFNNEIFKQ